MRPFFGSSYISRSIWPFHFDSTRSSVPIHLSKTDAVLVALAAKVFANFPFILIHKWLTSVTQLHYKNLTLSHPLLLFTWNHLHRSRHFWLKPCLLPIFAQPLFLFYCWARQTGQVVCAVLKGCEISWGVCIWGARGFEQGKIHAYIAVCRQNLCWLKSRMSTNRLFIP